MQTASGYLSILKFGVVARPHSVSVPLLTRYCARAEAAQGEVEDKRPDGADKRAGLLTGCFPQPTVHHQKEEASRSGPRNIGSIAKPDSTREMVAW